MLVITLILELELRYAKQQDLKVIFSESIAEGLF